MVATATEEKCNTYHNEIC